MHDDTIAGSTTAKGSVRTLTAQELPLLREHLLRLDPESRRDRFNGYIDEDFIARYAAKCQTDGTIIVAYHRGRRGAWRGGTASARPVQSVAGDRLQRRSCSCAGRASAASCSPS